MNAKNVQTLTKKC